MTVRTRFAPSPTGFMHLGNLRTALYTYLYAKSQGGQFILRIEDTDQERYVPGATEVIYDTLRDCGVLWDEGPDVGGDCGPYVQSERKDIYLPYAKQLVEQGDAYYCFCTKEEIEERRAAATERGETFKYDKHCLRMDPEEVQRRLAEGQPYVIRQNVPLTGESGFDDLVFGHIEAANETLDDMVLIKQDGMPTYNFANVIDDHLMGITHVIRGMEYLSSTPKYNLLYKAFGWQIPEYIHLAPVMKDQHQKLSKRNGDAYYSDYIEKGYLKDALVNYLVLLGWNPGDEREFFNMEQLKQAFGVAGLSKSPAIFDTDKLRWFNAEYIRRMTPEQFTEAARPWYEKAGIAGMDEGILQRILQPRVEVFSELPQMVDFLTALPDFDTSLYAHKKMKTTPEGAKETLLELKPRLQALESWTEESVHDLLLGFAQEKGVKNGQVMWPLRIAITGKAVTPGGAVEAAVLLGREETLKRLETSLSRF